MTGVWIDSNHEVMYALASKITFICQMDFNAFPVDIQVLIKYPNVDWYHGYKSFTFDPLKQFKQEMIKFSSSVPLKPGGNVK